MKLQLPRPRASASTPAHVIVYSRPGCHLCEEALALLGRLHRRYPLTVEEIDIESDAELVRRYDIRIPVLRFDDGTEIEAPIREEAVRNALRIAARHR